MIVCLTYVLRTTLTKNQIKESIGHNITSSKKVIPVIKNNNIKPFTIINRLYFFIYSNKKNLINITKINDTITNKDTGVEKCNSEISP